MKAIIIDDTPQAIDVLAQKLRKYEDIELVGTSTKGIEGLELMRAKCPDVVFLDVELPDMSGLDFLVQMNNISQGHCLAVMYTGFERYMLSSFRNNAFDFLLKPVEEEELDQVVQRLRTNRGDRQSVVEFTDGKKSVVEKREDNKLLLYTNSVDFRLVHIHDIGVFQYNHEMRSWEVVVAGQRDTIRLKRNANNEVLMAIDDRFIQVSQRYIININYLMEVRDNICRFYPPFDKVDYVKVGRFFRKRLIERFSSL